MTVPFGVPLVAGLIGALAGRRLGETRDPRELVPGDPGQVRQSAATLAGFGEQLEAVGRDLGRVDVAGWTGAASNRFMARLASERPRWLLGSDAMAAASAELERYAEVLAWAQGQAGEAIELWERGEAVTEQARAEHNRLVAAAQEAASTVTSVVNRVLPVDIPQFFDPGAELRAQAEQLLEHARQELDQAGAQAANVLSAHGGRGPDSPSWLSAAAELADTAIRDFDLLKTEFDLTTEFDLVTGEQKDKSGWEVTLGKFTHGDSVWGWSGEGETQWGGATLSGSASADVLGYETTGQLSLTGEDGLKAELGASVYLLQAEAEGAIEYGIAEVGGRGEVFVGAEAEGYLSAGPDGLNAGVEAFAGARAEGEVYADVGGVGVGAVGEAWAGVGAEASVTFGRNDDGSFTIGGSAGAALKAGGRLGFEVNIDPPKIIDTATSAADAIGDFAGNTLGKVKFW